MGRKESFSLPCQLINVERMMKFEKYSFDNYCSNNLGKKNQ